MSAFGERAARAYYRLLLLAYPREFRRREGTEVAGVFAAACRESHADGGGVAIMRRLLRAAVDVPREGLVERFGGPRFPRGERSRSRRCGAAITELAADLRFAVRSLRRRPGWTLAIAATLALGIGANTAIFSVIDATLLMRSPWPDADRMLHVGLRITDGDVSVSAPVEDLLRWGREIDAFERLEAVESRSVVLSHSTGARRVTANRATTGYLDALGVEPLLGRFLRADDARPDASAVAVMPEAVWSRLYGRDPQLLGESVELDGVAHVVIGVAPNVRGMPEAFITPLPVAGPTARGILAQGLVWLRPGVSLPQVEAQFAAVSQGTHERWGPFTGELHGPRNEFWAVDEFRSGLLALTAAVFLVLTIACVNVANLLLAAAGTRSGELTVRAALGAGRARLVRFMLAESLLLSLLGCALGVVVAVGGIRVMRYLAPRGQLGDALGRVQVDGTVLTYAVLVAALAGLAFGMLPALRGAAGGERRTLQEADPRAGGGSRRLRGVMVTVETALSLVLLVAAGLTLRSFVELRFTDPGFDADRILSVWVTPPEARYADAAAQAAFFEDLRTAVAEISAIEAVSLGAGAVPPSDLVSGGEMVIEGRDEPVETWITVSLVEPDFLDFMGIPLLAGRDIDEGDVRAARAGEEHAVVINRSLAQRYWPQGDALGARFRLSLAGDARWNRVVGIAADVRQRGLEAPSDMLHMYLPLNLDRRYGQLLMRLRPGLAPPVAEVRAAINRLDPQIPSDELETAVAGMLDSISGTRFRAALFGAFGLLAMVLAGLGIFGVVAYSVVQRTAEMGIRLALGARPIDVRRLVLLQGSAPLLAGIGVGLLIALAATRLMAGFLHGVAPADPLTFALTAASLLVVGMLAIWIPARRATAVDPVMSLRRH